MSGLPEKNERNKQLYEDRLNGMTWRELMIKYNLALTRVQLIFKREQAKLEPLESSNQQ